MYTSKSLCCAHPGVYDVHIQESMMYTSRSLTMAGVYDVHIQESMMYISRSLGCTHPGV